VTLCAGTALLFAVELLQETGRLGTVPERMPRALQLLALLALVVSVPLLGPTSVARGFIYAQF
jgi:hypothetical protein